MVARALLIRALLVWLVPLAISFLFYDRDGELTTSYAFFKSVMAISLVWIVLVVVRYRPGVTVEYPWTVALLYWGVSLGLDMLFLLPFLELTLGEYLEQIGLMYLIIPSLTLALLLPPLRTAQTA
jgi:hypothetical protein